MSLGPVMLDIAGTALTAEDRELLRHPAVGGVIYFRRNFASPEQIAALSAEIHALRHPQLIIAVDHEGGRVQRFRDGFSRLPAAAVYGQRYDADRRRGLTLAESGGWLMAAELRAAGVDLSFAPVLDLGWGPSTVIGDRAFHRDPDAVTALAQAYMRGMHAAGMAAVGKHFPGHGHVAGDSHHELPVDFRDLADLLLADLLPFERLGQAGMEAVMPAHVVYPQIDARPAGFSRRWIQDILRTRLGFAGAVFSDDLDMAGAREAGGYGERAQAALEAGCDMVLVCNNRAGAIAAVEALRGPVDPVAQVRLMRLHGRPAPDRAALQTDERWVREVERIARAERDPSLDLDF